MIIQRVFDKKDIRSIYVLIKTTLHSTSKCKKNVQMQEWTLRKKCKQMLIMNMDRKSLMKYNFKLIWSYIRLNHEKRPAERMGIKFNPSRLSCGSRRPSGIKLTSDRKMWDKQRLYIFYFINVWINEEIHFLASGSYASTRVNEMH